MNQQKSHCTSRYCKYENINVINGLKLQFIKLPITTKSRNKVTKKEKQELTLLFLVCLAHYYYCYFQVIFNQPIITDITRG